MTYRANDHIINECVALKRWLAALPAFMLFAASFLTGTTIAFADSGNGTIPSPLTPEVEVSSDKSDTSTSNPPVKAKADEAASPVDMQSGTGNENAPTSDGAGTSGQAVQTGEQTDKTNKTGMTTSTSGTVGEQTLSEGSKTATPATKESSETPSKQADGDEVKGTSTGQSGTAGQQGAKDGVQQDPKPSESGAAKAAAQQTSTDTTPATSTVSPKSAGQQTTANTNGDAPATGTVNAQATTGKATSTATATTSATTSKPTSATAAKTSTTTTTTASTTAKAASTATTTPTPSILEKNGVRWYQLDGVTKYHDHPQLVKVGNDYYYILKNGRVSTDARHTIDETNSNGLVKAGTYSFYSNGKLVKVSGLYKKDTDSWYYQDKNWALILGKVVKSGDKRYLTDSYGKVMRNGNYHVTKTQAGNGVTVGYYHINKDGTMEVSFKPTELKEALDNKIHLYAKGGDNCATVRVYYTGLDKKIDQIRVEIKSKNSNGNTITSKHAMITKGKDGYCTLSFKGLSPNSSYTFSVHPGYRYVTPTQSTLFLYYSGKTEKAVKTSSKNTCKKYKNATAQNTAWKALTSGKSMGSFFVQISKANYTKLAQGKIFLHHVFTDALTADTTKRLGSLLPLCLDYSITQNDVWKSGNAYYVGVTLTSRSNANNLKTYKKMVSWYDNAKKQAASKKTEKDKCKVVAKYLMDRCTYDWAAYNRYCAGDYSYHGWAYNSKGPVLHKTAVCSGYASAFKKLCAYVGIKCEIVDSDSHAWNLVKIGSKWYHYDVTWNDCVGSQKTYSFMGTQQAYKDKDHRTVKMSAAFKKAHPLATKSLKW